MTATTAELTTPQTTITRPDANTSVLVLAEAGPAVCGGTSISIDNHQIDFPADTQVIFDQLVPGGDYGIRIDELGQPVADLVSSNPLDRGYIAGFHFAPGGNAKDKQGGDTVPAINPFSLWDLDFRPRCPDPRGMALIDIIGGKRIWADIYLLNKQHRDGGTSRFGAVIADGRDRPQAADGGIVSRLDYTTAVAIYAGHGKRLLGVEEFFAAAYGVKERCSREDEPTLTGEMADGAEHFISAHGLFDVTGTMWQWGTDGHPDDPRPSVFGGSWIDGSVAGSRFANLDDWAGSSRGPLSARGACDHLAPV